ncbi:MAG: fibronectin type III domain-containing protein, partial [Kiritimatiellae bacterium]|nr:fibronectin type III domain-containing protein [Kiritimatiellia bacterium]
MARTKMSVLTVVLLLLCSAVASWAATVAAPAFSKPHGFYDSSMSVTISSATAGATIRYTTNGSKPTTTYGTVLSNGGSLTVNRTTCLRACAIKSGMTTSQPFTQTYIFLSDVLKQPANPAGFPAQLRRSAYDDWWVADYAMDPEVVNNSRYSGMIKGAFKSIPTLSLVVNINEMFGTNGALLGAKSGMAKPEIACSAELIYADGRPGFQIDCGLKPHSHTKQKRSLRLLFKTNYGGPAKLDYPFFEDAPVESQSAASSFGKIFLRGGMNQSWAALGNEETAYARDAWSMVTQIAMSGIGPHTTYCHLYINGLYWGLYQPLERPDARFMADYRGGAKGDWDSNNMAGLVSGNATRWNKIWQDLGTRDLSGTSNYNEMAAYLNVRHFADYVIQWWASGGGDWQEWWGKNNYYVANRRNPAEPLLFFAWDMDSCWQIQQPERGRANDGAWVKPQFLTPDEGATNRFYHPENARWYNVAFDASVNQHIARPFRALWKNAEFRMLFADRLYAHCTNGGALTDANAKGRWNALCNYIKDAVVCESARWGDHKKDYDDSSLPVYTRDTHWYGARDKVLTMMTGNAARMLSICRNQIMEGNMLYPSLDPPVFSQYGGSVAAGFKLTLSRVGSAGTIYYRTDGQDPRVSGGGIRSGSSTGTANAVVTLNASATVTARLKNGATWSALAHAKFTVTSGPTVPAAPGGLAAAALSTSQIKLTWADNSGDEDNFKVERRPAGGSWAQIAQLGANATAHTDSGLAAATPYEYRVRASNSAGNSAYSNVAGATTTDNPPAAPSNLAAAALSISQIKLTWADNSNNEVKFELQRSLDGSAWTEIAEPAANATAYTDSGLAAGTQYYYRVNASNAAGDSPNSNVASATTQAAVIPNIAVSTTSITASCTQGQNPPDQTFQVWNGGTGTLQYELVESTDKLSVAPTTGNSTGSANKKTHTVTFTIDNLEPGTYDRTISVEDNGSGAANSPVVINVRMVVEQGVPAAPSGLTATALSASEIRLSWADNSGSELKFEIQRSLDGSAWAEIAEPAADATTYTDSGLAAGTRYYYRIDASNGAGDSPFSNVASATTTLNAPAAPSGLTATALS